MKYTTIEPKLGLADINRAVSSGIKERPFFRSTGTHLSTIIQQINKDSGRLKEKIVFGRNTFDPIDEDDLPLCMSLGLAFETMIMQLNPYMSRTGEVHKDGIAMSPDAVTLNCRNHLLSPHKMVPVVLEECKLTWKSSSRMLEEHVNYLQQCKAYCYALDTIYCRLHITHVCGNYRFGDSEGGGPHYYQHHIEFTPWELRANWDEILRKKKEYGL